MVTVKAAQRRVSNCQLFMRFDAAKHRTAATTNTSIFRTGPRGPLCRQLLTLHGAVRWASKIKTVLTITHQARSDRKEGHHVEDDVHQVAVEQSSRDDAIILKQKAYAVACERRHGSGEGRGNKLSNLLLLRVRLACNMCGNRMVMCLPQQSTLSCYHCTEYNGQSHKKTTASHVLGPPPLRRKTSGTRMPIHTNLDHV